MRSARSRRCTCVPALPDVPSEKSNRSFVAEAVGCSTEFLKIAGMILCYPVLTSKEEYTHLESIHNLLGEDYEAKKEEMALENQVGPHTPPAFLWHTFADDAVPFQNSLFFVVFYVII